MASLLPLQLRTTRDSEGIPVITEFLAPEYEPVLPSRYELSRRIGEGASSTIWAATDRAQSVEVALKMPVRPQYQPYVLKRFAGEYQTVKSFEHPNILRAFDVDASGQEFTPYLATELVPGQTLDDRRRSYGAMGLDRVADAGVQLTDALRTIHAAGLVHRDVKPENVMLTGNGQVRLIDFGSAARSGDPDVAHTVGTWGYAAPEAADAHGALLNRRPKFVRPLPDASVDIYGAGLILHEAATGRLVFEDPADRGAQIDAHVPRLSDVLDNVPPKLDQLVADMTAKEPGDRPTAAEASATLGEIVADLRPGAPATDVRQVHQAAALHRSPDEAQQAVTREVAQLRALMSGQARPGRVTDSSADWSGERASAGLDRQSRKRQGPGAQHPRQPPHIG